MIPSTSLIPIHDDNPTRGFSYVTAGIIAINVLVLFFEPHLGSGNSPEVANFFYRWGLVPWEITHGHPVALSGCFGACFPHKNIYLAIFTSMFLHAGVVHLAGNMLFLWIFGNNIEDTLGRVAFLAFYLVCGVLAALSHVALNPSSIFPTVGASGAVAGVLGAYLVLFPRARVLTGIVLIVYIQFIRLPAAVVLGFWFVFQLFTGASQQIGGGGVAWAAHVGGFLAGAALIFLFGGRSRVRPPPLPEPLGPPGPWGP